ACSRSRVEAEDIGQRGQSLTEVPRRTGQERRKPGAGDWHASWIRCALVHCPALNIFGTFFPSWMLCGLIGIVAVFIVSKVLPAVQTDRWVGPRLLVFPSIALVVTAAVWLTRYGH